MDLKDFLVNASNMAGMSGYEGSVAAYISQEFSRFCPDVYQDTFGNLIAHKAGTGKLKIMLAAHMDEIGLMVSHIDDNGFIGFSPVSGIDPRTLVSQEVIIHGKEPLLGVIGIKPPHITTEKERNKAPKFEDMAIDCGLPACKVNELVTIGDMVTLNKKAVPLLNNRIAGKAMDNRAGVAVLYAVMKNLKDFNHDVDLYYTATAQEEVGKRGAVTSAYSLEPDIAIVVDATYGKAPGLSDDDSFDLGAGPAIGVGTCIHPKLYGMLKDTAAKNKIKYQIEVIHRDSGTDADKIQESRNGIATATVSVPVRYMHQAVETVDLSDIEAAGKLISEFIVSLNDISPDDILDM